MRLGNSGGKGDSGDGEKEGRGERTRENGEINKGRSLWLPLFFVVAPVGTRFRWLVAAGHVKEGGT